MNNYNNIINFYKQYIELEQIIRKGWIMRSVPAERLESVADHTLQLIMLASVITKELKIDIDYKRLIDMLIIHDLGETIVGDISEVELNRQEKKIEEAKAIKELLNTLSEENADYYYKLWLEMESKSTETSKFAYLLDKIDAVIKAGIYEKQYNVEGLFDEFSGFQKQRQTFNNSILEELFEFINERFDKNNKV